MVGEVAARDCVAAKHGHLRELGLPTMLAAVALLVSATLLLGANISALRGNLAMIAHSQQVVRQTSELETGLLGEELIVRGYALTGDPSFLRMQRTGARRREATSIELTRLIAVEPQRADQLRMVMRDIARHVEIFDRLGGIGPDKSAIVARAIVDPSVRDNMRRVRTGLRQLRADELNDLAARQREITEQLGRAFFLAIGIIVTAFVLGGIGIWAAQRSRPAR